MSAKTMRARLKCLHLPDGFGTKQPLLLKAITLSELKLGLLSICLPGELNDESVWCWRSVAPRSKARRIAIGAVE
jgi:hypothetical protein